MDIQAFLSEAYPIIFERALTIFPEFAFEPLPDGKGYRSTNTLKIDGSDGNKVGAVYYYADALYGLKDYTRGFISIYNYIKQRDQLADNQVLDRIATLTGKLFTGFSRSTEEEAQYRLLIRKSELLEEANSFFIHCLSHKDNPHAQSKRAAALRNYLLYTRRYPVSILRLPDADFTPQQAHQKMELGFMPGIKFMNEHLKQAGFSMDEIMSYLVLPQHIAYQHILTLPYRNKLGMIRGFAFRTIDQIDSNKTPKYLYSNGLDRGNFLLGMRKRQHADWVVVEGILDAMHAAAQGLEGVVAIGGATLTEGQLTELLHSQPRSITLCLDNDQAGRLGTDRALEKLLPHSDKFHLYIAQLPAEIKDLDELIVNQGIQAAKSLLQRAESVAYYYHQRLVSEAQTLEQDNNGKLSDKDFDRMLDRITETEMRLADPLDMHRFRHLILQAFSPYALHADTLAFKSQALREIQQEKKYLDQLTKLNRQAAEALSKGKINEAERLFTERFRALRVSSQSQKFVPLRIQPSEAQLRAAFAQLPPSIDSGYALTHPDWQPLLLPHGAISLFCAPTSHGKTTMLLNLALNIADRYPDRQIHFFSYEEAQPAIFLKALNAYLDLDLHQHNNQALEHFFRTGSFEAFFPPSEPEFIIRKNLFFKELVEKHRLHIHYVEYTSDELIEAIHFLQKQGNIAAIVIDYMQLLQLADNKKGRLSRQEELKQICTDLKDCAVETGLPLVIGAQFNREVTNHFRVHATKIGEAGDIERIASVVVGMWNNDFEPFGMQLAEEMQIETLHQPDTIWLKLLKNRGGRVGGSALLPYNGNRSKIYPIQQDSSSQNRQGKIGGGIIKF